MLKKLTRNRKQIPPLKTLPVFVAVAKHLSFSKAAKELFVTHSAISQSIKQLETFLGKPLFVRDKRSVALTVDGKKYLIEIQAALEMIEHATFSQRFKNDNILTINAGTSFVMSWLIPRLEDFQQQHPEISLRVSTIESSHVDFTTDHIDVSILYGDNKPYEGLHSELLFDDFLVAVTSSDYLNLQENLKPDSLPHGAKYIFVDAPLRKNDWNKWCQHANINVPKETERVYFQSTVQAIQAAANGLGILVTHKLFVENEIALARLTLIGKPDVLSGFSYMLTCPDKTVMLGKIKSFREWVLTQT